MADLQNFVKKAFYLGIGAASYAGEQANNTLSNVQQQAQSLAEEMIRRGEMTADEARQWLDSLTEQSADTAKGTAKMPDRNATAPPRTIEVEIDDAEVEPDPKLAVNDLHKKVDDLQEELRRLQS